LHVIYADAGALLDWMRTPQAREVPRRKDGTSYGDTGEGLARRLLDACQLRRTCNGRPATLWLKITYRHAELGDWLLAAGWVSFSRLYADGADPFRLPSAIRRIALAKFGWELDDAAAYMRIVSLLLPDLRVCVPLRHTFGPKVKLVKGSRRRYSHILRRERRLRR
jgi:hypothetical protein